MIDDFALLFNCKTVVRVSDLMPAFLAHLSRQAHKVSL